MGKTDTDWARDVIPGYSGVLKNRIVAALKFGPRSVLNACDEAGVHAIDYGRLLIDELRRERRVTLNRQGDVLWLGTEQIERAHPVAMALAREFSCQLIDGRKPTWCIRCLRCSAGWLIGDADLTAYGATAHLHSAVRHLAVHAESLGGGL